MTKSPVIKTKPKKEILIIILLILTTMISNATELQFNSQNGGNSDWPSITNKPADCSAGQFYNSLTSGTCAPGGGTGEVFVFGINQNLTYTANYSFGNLSGLNINVSGLLLYKGREVNASVDLAGYNKSISLVSYNQSVDLSSYNRSISLDNLAYSNFQIANGTALPFSNFQLSNVSNDSLRASANASIALFNLTCSGMNCYVEPRLNNWTLRVGQYNWNNTINDTLVVYGSVAHYGSLNATFLNATQILGTVMKVGTNDVLVTPNASTFVRTADGFNTANLTTALKNNVNLQNAIANGTNINANNITATQLNITTGDIYLTPVRRLCFNNNCSSYMFINDSNNGKFCIKIVSMDRTANSSTGC